MANSNVSDFQKKREEDLNLLTIVILTKTEEDVIGKALQSAQGFRKEIIVIGCVLNWMETK